MRDVACDGVLSSAEVLRSGRRRWLFKKGRSLHVNTATKMPLHLHSYSSIHPLAPDAAFATRTAKNRSPLFLCRLCRRFLRRSIPFFPPFSSSSSLFALKVHGESSCLFALCFCIPDFHGAVSPDARIPGQRIRPGKKGESINCLFNQLI